MSETERSAGSEVALRSLQESVGCMPIRGYVIDEDADRLWLRDPEGTWLIHKPDIIAARDWDGVNDPRLEGTPRLLFVREGADIYETRKFRVALLSQPITLKGVAHGSALTSDNGSVAVADDSHPSHGEREVGFRPGTGVTPLMSGSPLQYARSVDGHQSVCCWDSNWGMTCQVDDCK